MVGLDARTATVVVSLVVLAGFGVVLLLRARRTSSARSLARAWPRTTGTVLSSTVQVTRNGSSRHEHPLVLYAYQVDGQLFQGDRVRAGDELGRVRAAGTPMSASATVARYPAGTAVTVYYDPTNPAISALER